jgi:cytochrome c551
MKKSIVDGRWSIAVLLWTMSFGLSTVSCTTTDPKFQQYFVQGQVLYEKYCSNCHQKNGQGLGRLYPPVASSDYFVQHLNESICLMKYGTEGKIIVNGKDYNKRMPGIPSLTELELAEISTYISNSWGLEKGMTEIASVKNALEACAEK